MDEGLGLMVEGSGLMVEGLGLMVEGLQCEQHQREDAARARQHQRQALISRAGIYH